MKELPMLALYRMSTLAEGDRRATEENAGRMFAAPAGAVHRFRAARPAETARPAATAVVRQPGTPAR